MARKTASKSASSSRKGARSKPRRSALVPKLQALIARADKAFNTYRHADALEAYSQALAWTPADGLPAEERFRLLRQRAETFRALGDSEAQQADVANLEPLALDIGRVDLITEAAVRRADGGVGSRDPQRTVRLAKKALKMAEAAGDPIMQARALDALGTTYVFGLEQADQARKYLERALELFGGEGRADWSHAHVLVMLAFLPNQEGAITSERYGQMALDIVRRAGDQRAETRVLNLMAIFANDAADKRRYAEQALALAQELDLRETTAQAYNHLSLLYLHMGLYKTALESISRGVEIARQGLGRVTLSAFLESYARVAAALDDHAAAEAAFAEALQIGEESGQRSFIGYDLLGLGRLKLAAGDPEGAARLIKRAVDLFRELGAVLELSAALAALAEVRLDQDKWRAALKLAQEASREIQAVNEANQDFPPQDVWRTYFRVLMAHPKNLKYLDPSHHAKGTLEEEAQHALGRAYDLAASTIASVSDYGLRRSYWNKVEVNRSILLETARRNTGGQWRSPVLSDGAEGNLQDQLQRMLDIGVRMNELKDPDELIDFIMDQLVELSGAEQAALIVDSPDGKRQCLGKRGFVSGVDPVTRVAPVLKLTSRHSVPVLLENASDQNLARKSRSRLHSLSVLCVPLTSKDFHSGWLYVDNHSLFGPFTQADQDLLSAFANQASAALDNASLYRTLEDRVSERTEALRSANSALEDRAAELSIINGVQQALASQLDIQSIFNLVGDRIQELFDAQIVQIITYDPAKNLNQFNYVIERGEKLSIEPMVPGGFSGEVLRTHQPLVINEGLLAAAERFGASVLAGEVIKSYIGVPLLVGEQARGVISLQNIDREHAFSESDLRLLTTLSSSMSVALENARLFDETQRLLQVTEQRAAELAVINSIQEGLAAQLDIQGIFNLVGDKIRDIFDAQVVGISTYDKGTGIETWPYILERGQRMHVDPAPTYGFSEHMFRTLEPLMINTNIERRLEEFGADVMVGEPAKSYLGVPLIVGNEAKGSIDLQNLDRENAFDDSDFRLLSTIASSMSVALENARLFEATNRLLEETRQRAAELAIINSVQQGLAAQLDLNGIIRLVGDKVREIVESDIVAIGLYDRAAAVIRVPYLFEDGQHATGEVPYGKGLASHIVRDKKTLLINEDFERRAKELGAVVIGPDTGLSAKSWLGVPIIVGDDVIGGISISNSEREHAYSEADVRLVETLASSMSVALENARLFDETNRLLAETRQHNAELAAISAVSQALVAETEIDKLIELIGEQVRQAFKADVAYVAMYDPRTDLVNFPYLYGDKSRPIRLGEGMASQVLLSGQPLLLNQDIDRAMAERKAKRVGVKAASYLGVPITAGRQTIGVISVQSTHSEGRFSQSDVNLLTTMAASAGAAIRNAQLHHETERRASELAALNEIGREAAASLDLPTVLDRITHRAREVLSAETSAVILLDEDGRTLRPIAAAGDTAQAVMAFSWTLGEGIIGDIVKSGRAERISDAVADPRAVHIAGTRVAHHNEKLMVAPLWLREQVIGAMAVWREANDELFDDDDLSFLTGLAQQAGVTIHNARLFDEVQRQKQYSEAIVQNNPVAIITTDLDARVVSWNPAAETLFGFTEEEAMGQPIDGLITNEAMRPEAEANTRKALDEGGFNAVMRRARKDGTLVEVEAVALPVMIDGQTVGFIAIYHDITELKRAEEALLQQKEYLEAVLQNTPVAIVTTDIEARVVSWNPAAEILFGYSEAEAIGENIDRLVAGSEAEMQVEAAKFSSEARDGRLHVNTQRVRKDGSLVDVELLGVPVMVDGRRAGLIAIYHDITELLKAQRAAEAANEAKGAFLATMSHEIRTPMNAVIGMSGLMLDTELSDEQREYAEIIRNSSDALLAIINDILDFSKIEAGKMELEFQPFDLRECTEGTLDLVAGRAYEKNLDLAYFIEDGTPTRIIGDVTRFRQILLNLLTNAVKFTDKGEVVVTLSSPKTPPSNGGKGPERLIEVSVRDSGIGIPPDRMNRLFQSFSQVDASTARKYGGTGLGLAISRRLAEMMGGSMWAESVPGEGATFYFTLLAQEAPETGAAAELRAGDPHLYGRRVLVVDDNDTNRRILGLQVKGWGMIPKDTHSPRQALEWIRAGEEFDLAILDMHMPEIDGLSLAREIRKARGRLTLPLILFTSLGRRELETDDIEFAAFLTKPIKPSQLLDALTTIFADQPVPASKRPAEPPRIDPGLADRHPLRILLAEDNAVNQKLALRLLQQMGYRADVAANGLEALESLKRQTYDVVLMDVQMPEMDGLEASRQINRQWTQSERPRIVAMTANAMQGDRERCIEAGMDDYITKPVRIQELMDALTRIPSRGRA